MENQSSALTEESIIKKRLLNDESILRRVTGSTLKFLEITNSGLEPALVQNQLQLITEDLAELDYFHLKNYIKSLNIAKDRDYYTNLQSQTEKINEETSAEIKSLEEELELTSKKKTVMQ